MIALLTALKSYKTKNLFDILLSSRTVWVGITAIALGIADILLLTLWGIDLPLKTGPEILILGGLAAIYAKGGNDVQSSNTES